MCACFLKSSLLLIPEVNPVFRLQLADDGEAQEQVRTML